MVDRSVKTAVSPVRSLLWLKAKLTLRQFSRERGRILGALFALVIFGPLVVGATIGTVIGYQRLDQPAAFSLFGIVLVVLWIIWLMFPIVLSSINEGLDIRPLLIYPLSRRDLVVGTLVSTLLDYPTYLMLPLFGAALYGLGVRWPLVVALLLAYGHLVIIGQLVLTAVGGILQSRRFRDVSIIFFSLIGTSCYFLNEGVARVFSGVSGRFGESGTFQSLDLLPFLRWLPTGALAQFVASAEQQAWGEAAFWLGYSVILLTLFTSVWIMLLYRLATGGGFLLSLPPKTVRAKAKRQEGQEERPLLPTWLPNDIAAVALKELRTSWRIPQRRVGFLQGFIFPFFILTGAFFDGGETFGRSEVGNAAPFILIPYALFAFWAGGQNILAWEGSGLATLLLTPAPRHRIMMAKSAPIFAIVSVPYLLIGLILLAVRPSLVSAASLLVGLCVGLASMGVMAVASVLFPTRINVEGKNKRSSFQMSGGCRAAFGSVLLTPLILILINVPTALALLLGHWQRWGWLTALSPLIALLYAPLLFWYGNKLAGNLLLEREPEVLEALRQPEG